MSLKDYKISNDAVQNVYVQSQPDILNGTTQENKAVFDKYPALIKDRFNDVLEILGGDSAASEMLIQAIEGLTAVNVQQALAELKRLLDAYIAKIKSTAGAAEVGVSAISGMQAQNAQAALGELKALIDNLVVGALPPGSVTADMIADGAIVQLGALLAVAAAAAYDPEGSYAVGDYCTHGGKLHKCNTPIESGEEWTADHWTETTVAAELDSRVVVGGHVSNADANTIIRCGIYQMQGNISNLPVGVTQFGQLFVMYGGEGDTIAQMYNDYDNNIMWLRSGSGINVADKAAVWSKWVNICTGTPPQEYDLPLPDGITALQPCTYYKNQFSETVIGGHVVGTIDEGTVIGTLPVGFRPGHIIERPATLLNGPNRYSGSVAIDTTGMVIVHTPYSSTNVIFGALFTADN